MSRPPCDQIRVLAVASLVVLACIPAHAAAQTATVQQSEPQTIDVLGDALRLAAAGQNPQAIILLQQRLEARPDDMDARILVGIILSWDGHYAEARAQLRIVLRTNPGYHDAVAVLANIELLDGQAETALSLASSALRRDAKDVGMMLTRARAAISLGRLREARDTVDHLLAVEPGNQAARDLRTRLADNDRLWSVGVGYGGDWFSDRRRPWQEQSVVMKRQADLGSVSFTWSQARQYGLIDQQYDIQFHPRLRPGTHLHLDAGGAAHANLYPTYRAGAELYQSLGGGFEASVGMSRLGFGRGINIYIGSLSKYMGSWLFVGHVFVTPHDLGTNASYQAAIRRYLSGKEYAGVGYHHGAARESMRTINDVLVLNADGVFGDLVLRLGSHVALTCRGAYERQQRALQSSVTQYSAGSRVDFRF
jgi:YaiO family outer membrane protein